MRRRVSVFAGVMVAVLGLVLVGFLEGCSKPAMPVTFSYRESAIGEGYVAQFQNPTDKYLQVRLKITNPTLNHEKDGYLDLTPHDFVEIGWMQGWKLVSGEKIYLSHEDYAPASYRIP